MMTVRDAGSPRDADLPTLRPAQIDALVDELIARSSADPAEPMINVPARIEPGPRWQWSGRAGLLAVASVVGIIAVASVVGRPAAAPSVDPATPVSQAPAPNFPCEQPGGTVLTDRTVYLPNPNYGARTLLGMVGDQLLCTAEQPSGVTSTYGAPKPGAVPFFSLTGDLNGTQQAYGVVDGSITRVQFIPHDAARPSEDAAALIAFGDDLVFYFPGIDNGVVRFYRGDTVIAEQTVGPTPYPAIEPTPTGQACGPTWDSSRPDLSNITLTDANGQAIYADVYPEPHDPVELSEDTSGRLCLLVQWAAPAVSASAQPLDSGQPLTYVTKTPAAGGTFIWGRLTAGASTVALTDASGIVTSLSGGNLNSSQSGQVSFVAFVPPNAAQIVSAQALNSDGAKIGEPVRLP